MTVRTLCVIKPTLWSLLCGLSLLACSASSNDNSFGSASGGSGGSDSGGSGGSSNGGSGGNATGGSAGSAGSAGFAGGAGNAGANNGCSEGVGDYVLVVTSENYLLRFYPGQDYKFETVSTLSCPASNGASPFSMALDRNGTAWVLYQSGEIFHVNSATGACQQSGYSPSQMGWEVFGMGFVADTNGSTTETLYVIDGTGSGGLFGGESAGLGKIDTTTLTLSGVGQFNGGLDGRSAEVTGRGDGKLFGFFVDTAGLSAPSVAEIDKSNANVISNVTQNGLASSISAWAFAHWGGSFYMFNAGSGQTASQVNKYTPASGTTPAKMELVVPSVTADGTPVRIVGAGVSTCAPTEEPIELSAVNTTRLHARTMLHGSTKHS